MGNEADYRGGDRIVGCNFVRMFWGALLLTTAGLKRCQLSKIEEDGEECIDETQEI
jgi:hypothetical protein